MRRELVLLSGSHLQAAASVTLPLPRFTISSPLLNFSGIVPTLINIADVPDPAAWLQDPRHVYIGRRCYGMRVSSIWANNFKITKTASREQCIKNFEASFKSNKFLQDALPQLCYKTLGCWCVPSSCHGHVLIDAIKHMLLIDIEYI